MVQTEHLPIYKFRGAQRLLAERVLRLTSAWGPRGGFALVAGFRRELAPIFRTRALRRGIAVPDVEERPGCVGGPTLRIPSRLSSPYPRRAAGDRCAPRVPKEAPSDEGLAGALDTPDDIIEFRGVGRELSRWLGSRTCVPRR